MRPTPKDVIHDYLDQEPPSQTGWTLVTVAVLFAAGAVIGALWR